MLRVRLATAAAFAAALALGVASCSGQGEKVAAPQAKAASALDRIDYVTKVEVYESNAQVTALVPEAWDGPAYVDAASALIGSIAKTLQAHPTALDAGVETVQVLVQAPHVDKYGNDAPERFLNVAYNVDDLRRANVEGLGSAGLLNLAREARTSSPAGGRAVESWCGKSNNGEGGAAFCAQTLE